MKKHTLVWILSLLMVSMNAQNKKWEKNLKENLYKVGWIKQSNEGKIIASGAKGIVALDKDSGKILWHNKEVKNVNKNSFMNVGSLPLFYVEFAPVLGKKQGVLIDSHSGKNVYNTKDEGYKIKNYTFLPESKMILFELEKEKESYLMKFDLNTKKESWVLSVGKQEKSRFKMLMSLGKSSSFIKHAPQFNQKGEMIIGTEKDIICVDIQKGEIVWKKKMKNKIKALVYSEINNNLYVGVRKSNRLIIFDPVNGEDITPGKLKLRGYMVDIKKGKGNDLILIETEGFNIINTNTNTFKWKKSFKLEPISDVMIYGDDYIAIGKDEKKGVVARVNNQGKKVWNSNIDGYAYYIQFTEKGVLYLSTERSNILDFNKGKDVWKKDIKFKSIPAVTYDTDEDKVVVFENKKGYKFDLKTGNLVLFAKDISLEKIKRDTPLKAEYLGKEGYYIYSDQHVSLLGKDGNLKYTNYYKPVSSSDLLFSLGNLAGSYFGVDLDIKGSIDNIKMLEGLSNGVYTNTLDQNDSKVNSSTSGIYTGAGNGEWAPLFETTKKRFMNSKQLKDYQFIVSNHKNNSGEVDNKILKINKKTGKVEKEIKLVDKTPNYILDNYDKRVIINEGNEVISSYDFN